MISVGLIGCGDIAEVGHLPTILSHKEFHLAAVCDVHRSRAELLAAQAGGVPVYADWNDMLASEGLDAVVLALPPEVSPAIVEASLRQKLAVLDEKPLAANLSDGRRLVKLIAESGGVYQIGFVLRYGNWVQELRRLSATLGSPLRINVEIYDEVFDPSDEVHFNRIQNFLKNSSALTHEGSHVIDYVSLWNRSPWMTVSAFAQQTMPDLSGPNVWNAQIDLADLSTLTVKVGWLLPELPPSTINIAGPAGRLFFNCGTGQGQYEVEHELRFLDLPPLAAEWHRQYDAFAAAVAEGSVKHATATDGLRALEITAACELSASRGMSVSRDEFQRHEGFTCVDERRALALPYEPTTKSQPRSIIGKNTTNE